MASELTPVPSAPLISEISASGSDASPAAASAAGTVSATTIASWTTCAVQSTHVASGAQQLQAAGPATALITRGQGENSEEDLAFLLVSNWSYPVIGQPVLRDGSALIMPAAEGFTFTLVPGSDVEAEDIALMVDFFARYGTVKDRETGAIIEPRPATWADTASSAFYAASRTAAVGLVKGANLAAIGIRRAGAYLKANTAPGSPDSSVSSVTKARVARAKSATTAAATITSGLVKSVTAIATTLGSGIAKSAGNTERGAALQQALKSQNGRAVRQVAAAGLVSFATLWEALEQSAHIVATSTSQTTSEVVQHRYGNEAAAVASDAMVATGQGVLAAYRVNHLGVKAVVRKVATSSAKHALQLEQGADRNQANADATLAALHAANTASTALTNARATPVSAVAST